MAIQSTFYSAWVDPTETTFGPQHHREDELILSFELLHAEGQFCELTIEIVNPHTGLLAPDRKLWFWFSWDDGTTVTPLFFGRLVAIPDDLFAEALKIKFVARPDDYAAQQTALANTLKVLPYFDPVFIDPTKQTNPDTALEGYSALWHVDRVTLAVTISDIITGEDGVIEFTQPDAFYDNLVMKLAGAPLLLCEIEAEVSWTQCDNTGVFTMKTVTGLTGNTQVGPGIAMKSGVSAPHEGFTVKEPTQVTYSWDFKNTSPGPHQDGDLMEESGSITVPYYGGELTSQSISHTFPDPDTGQGEEYSIKESYKDTYFGPPTPPSPPSPSPPPNPMNSPAQVATEVQQNRKEAVYVAVRADVQPVLAQMTTDEKSLTESLTMNSSDLVAVGATTASSGVYFSTARGQQSIEYLLLVARAHLLAKARVIEVDWECPFPKIVYSNMSCRMNATIEDPRLPGTTVLGKVVSYGITGDGDRGEFLGKVTIHSAVGNADPGLLAAARSRLVPGVRTVTNPGTPDYVEEGYVDEGYQHYTGRQVSVATNDMSFEDFAFVQTGLQLPITEDQILVRHEYHDGGIGQSADDTRALLQSGAAQLRAFSMDSIGDTITGPPAQALQYSAMYRDFENMLDQTMPDTPSWVEMEFKPVQGLSSSVAYSATVTPLSVPKQIDLAAT